MSNKVNVAFDALLGGLTITAAKELATKAARDGVTNIEIDKLVAAVVHAVPDIAPAVATAAAEAVKAAVLAEL